MNGLVMRREPWGHVWVISGFWIWFDRLQANTFEQLNGALASCLGTHPVRAGPKDLAGGLDYRTVSWNVIRFTRILAADKQIQESLEHVQKRFQNPET